MEIERALKEVEEFERRTAAQHEMENNFWQERKECYIKIKLWEDDRRNKTLMLGKVLISMTENILRRMLASVQENEVLTNYLESMIKIQLEHSQSLIKNANKYLDPLVTGYDYRAPQNSLFIKALKDLDVTHANRLTETTTKTRELIRGNISKNSDAVKKITEKLQSQFQKAQKIFNEGVKRTEKAYLRLL